MGKHKLLGTGVVTGALVLAVITAAGPASAASTTSDSGQVRRQAAERTRDKNVEAKVIRFKPGTSKAQMNSEIASAGASVVTDLSQQNRMVVMPTRAGFEARMSAKPSVVRIATDKKIMIERGEKGAGHRPDRGPNGQIVKGADPWHNMDSYLDQNAPGVLQWDDSVMNVNRAWKRTKGDRAVRVAVLDTGVDGSIRELAPNYDAARSANLIPCADLVELFGPEANADCQIADGEGHGTWVASRIAGSLNGFASNGVAPNVQIMGYKVLSTYLGFGLTSWIVEGMYQACDNDADLINMSLGGYDRLGVDDEDYLMWVDAVNYCRAMGTAIVASAGNEHVRINKTNLTVGGTKLRGVGQVSTKEDGISTIVPGGKLEDSDLRGLLLTPGGVPGVITVSATNNSNGDPGTALAHLASKPTVGKSNQLTYYSNYGSRIDIAAPGGARKYNVPRYDGGNGDVLYGGWGTLGALSSNGAICTDPSSASLLTFACFTIEDQSFGWLQGTSMSAPNATGVAALALSANRHLRNRPDRLMHKLADSTQHEMINETGPLTADKGVSAAGAACATGYCHVAFYPRGKKNPIKFSDAYGAGLIDAAKATD